MLGLLRWPASRLFRPAYLPPFFMPSFLSLSFVPPAFPPPLQIKVDKEKKMISIRDKVRDGRAGQGALI